MNALHLLKESLSPSLIPKSSVMTGKERAMIHTKPKKTPLDVAHAYGLSYAGQHDIQYFLRYPHLNGMK